MLVRLALHATLRAVDAAGDDELVAIVGARFDVAAVHADRRRAEEPLLLRALGVGDVDTANIRDYADLIEDTRDELERRPCVGAAFEGEHLDERRAHRRSFLGDMLGVVGEQCVAELEQRQHAFVGDAVENRSVLAAGRDEATPAQAREMVGDACDRDVETVRELTD